MMNVIGDSAYDDIGRIDAANNRCQISMHSWTDLFVEKRLPILRAENQMRIQLRE